MIYQDNLILFGLVFHFFSIVSQENIYRYQKYTHPKKLNHVISLDDFLDKHQHVVYTKCDDCCEAWYQASPLFFSTNHEYLRVEQPETFVLTIPQGKACSQCGFVDNSGKYIDELLWEPSLLKQCTKKNRYKINQPVKINGTVLMLLQEGASNYYHWMVEVVPKIGMLQRHGIKFDFIYTYYQKSFMQETLALLGFDGSKIIPAHDEYTSIQAEALIVPSFVSRFHYSVPTTFEYLRHELLPQALLQVDASQFSKKVFISRKNSNRRKIVNEASIIELLEKNGFVAYALEKLSVAEQIVLFSNAEIILAEHGAGLTNIIFCQPQTKVIEIFHSRIVPTYFDISMQLNLDYVGCIVPDEYKKVKDTQHSLHTYVSLDYIQFIIGMYID